MIKIKLNLRKIRIARRMTQHQLAILTGYSQSHISEIELDYESPTLRMVEHMSNVLEIHPFKLLSIEP